MIVTTNYDDALERAFETAGTPYDLAVFIASGEEKGRFVHVPWKGEPQLIAEASKYREFPIHGNDELERSVIVKIQGAVDGREGSLHWDRSYVLTEGSVHRLHGHGSDRERGPAPDLLNKLTSSHCLFLGYAMRDWSPPARVPQANLAGAPAGGQVPVGDRAQPPTGSRRTSGARYM